MKGFFTAIFDDPAHNPYDMEIANEKIYDKQYRKRSYNDPYKKETTHERENIFANNVLYFTRCKELEERVKQLERTNKFLIEQVTSLISTKGTASKGNSRFFSELKAGEKENLKQTLTSSKKEDSQEDIEFLRNGIETISFIFKNNKFLKGSYDAIKKEKNELISFLAGGKYKFVFKRIISLSANALLVLSSTKSIDSRMESNNSEILPKYLKEPLSMSSKNSKRSLSRNSLLLKCNDVYN